MLLKGFRRSAQIEIGIEKAANAHHGDLEKEDYKDAREGEAGAEEEHQEEQRRDDNPVDVLPGVVISA